MDYKLIDSGDGRRLERFGNMLLDRPDPEVIWDKTLAEEKWNEADAKFIKEGSKGHWQTKKGFPEKWTVSHDNLKFILRLTPFKHTGVFPEQSWQWDLIAEVIKRSKRENINLLSLFGYTGISSLAALSEGASVTLVDASRPAISWFKENQEASGLGQKAARVIIDDAIKFTAREIKRGKKYDIVVMDPPAYGHGPTGEPWDFSRDFPKLIDNVSKIISDNPLLIIINFYAVSNSATSIINLLKGKLPQGEIKSGELSLDEESAGRKLTTGSYIVWTPNEIK